MLSLNEIQKVYPKELWRFGRFILREYLQYKLLQIVFESEWSDKFSFLGGTCLRIVHGNSRFSEDLDFDNWGVNTNDFEALAVVIQKELEKEGYEIEMKTVYKGAYHCHVKFPKLLFQEGLTGHQEERILIQLDTESQNFAFKPDTYLLNRFDVFTQINTTPTDLLLAQKFYAILNRNRNKGRDFYDVVFLLAQNIKPNYAYLEQKIGIKTPEILKERIIAQCEKIDMKAMADDVKPFLFSDKDINKVLLFVPYLKQVAL